MAIREQDPTGSVVLIPCMFHQHFHLNNPWVQVEPVMVVRGFILNNVSSSFVANWTADLKER